MIPISLFKERWKRIRDDPRRKKIQKLLQRLIVLGIIGLILYQLADIGWSEVLQSLPTHPLFYVLFAALYMTLPVAEIFIYRQVWPFQKWEGLKAFLTKRVYNHEVVGYSGEFYLFLWGRKQADYSDKEVFKNIRDNTIISSITSNVMAILLLVALIATDTLNLSDLFGELNKLYVAAGLVILLVATAVFIQFRRYFFELPAKKTAVVFAIYVSRFIVHHAGMLLMWAVAIPEMPWSFWFSFLALLIVLNRIPFIPGKDLVFLSAGIEFARMADVAMASVAGMLLVYSALNKFINLLIFLLISWNSKEPEA